ncbi:UNVERIFIED_ORG: hypothetical protein QE434_002074 [Rhizobium sp. SORGH_AS 755]|nr:hypothetical protein [Rhizobium sp. SORGH_AS_0755]
MWEWDSGYEILTYDELFERSSFVVNNAVKPK